MPDADPDLRETDPADYAQAPGRAAAGKAEDAPEADAPEADAPEADAPQADATDADATDADATDEQDRATERGRSAPPEDSGAPGAAAGPDAGALDAAPEPNEPG